jgi:hypothetical protein
VRPDITAAPASVKDAVTGRPDELAGMLVEHLNALGPAVVTAVYDALGTAAGMRTPTLSYGRTLVLALHAKGRAEREHAANEEAALALLDDDAKRSEAAMHLVKLFRQGQLGKFVLDAI